MWKKFKWDMFVTSFIPLWLSIVVLDAWNIVLLALEKWDDKNQMLENLQNILYNSCIQEVSIIVIAVLVISSIVGVNSFLKKKLIVESNHPKGTVKKATKANKLSSEFLLLIRYLCFKIFQDNETKDVLEANTVTKLSIA